MVQRDPGTEADLRWKPLALPAWPEVPVTGKTIMPGMEPGRIHPLSLATPGVGGAVHGEASSASSWREYCLSTQDLDSCPTAG